MAFASGNKPQSRPILLLKDYLRDDMMSSCSSSGFKSFPRRQCCLHPRSSSSSCSAKSALQKASEAVLNVIKSLQIPAPQRSPSSSLSQTRRRKGKKGVLSRSFSRRLLSRNFWRRASSSKAKGDSNFKACTFVSTASSASANSDNSTWVETTFTCSLTAADESTDIEASVDTSTNSCSVTNSTREWPSEEKVQFSPVSVLDLDCPLFDDGEDISSPFNSTPCSSKLEGAKLKHMQQQSGIFNRVASEKRISWSELKSNLLCDNVVENILFDFFKQSIGDIINNNNNNDDDDDGGDVDYLIRKRNLCKVAVAEDLIRGQHQEQEQEQEQYLSWESRELYIKEMGKCRIWSTSCDEDIQCVAMKLELYIFTSLVKDLLLDLTSR